MEIKICGVRTFKAALAAENAGADMLGFVFFAKSPRHIAPAAAKRIAARLPGAAFPKLVGLYVDPDDAAIEKAAPFLDWVQLHGSETPERVAEIRARFSLPVMKALGVSSAADVRAALAYAADRILFDARPPKGAQRPGGHGAAFDWSILAAWRGETPFMLSGGLTPETVRKAISAARAVPGFAGVDVSSGVEHAPGEKDPARIAAFIRAARAGKG